MFNRNNSGNAEANMSSGSGNSHGYDKNIMNDMSIINARIYVGNIENGTTEDELHDKFSVYGKILGLSKQRNFGFIQYENEDQARNAIENANGIMFKGRKLGVAISRKPNSQKNNPPGPPNIERKEPPLHQQHQQNDKPVNQKSNFQAKKPRGGAVNRGGMKRMTKPLNNNNLRDRSPMDRGNQNFDSGKFNFANSRQPNPDLSAPLSVQTGSQQRNECEIIVVDKSLTSYSEFIEHRLKSVGLNVDLLFPNEDVPIGRVLANISSQGCLFAILVTPQNEQHNSLTLCILYDQPQEHRNIPVEDALTFILKNYDAYMRGEKLSPGSLKAQALNDWHPDAIQVLLNLLAQNRQLTVVQYDRVIKYLQEKRELQFKTELGNSSSLETETLGSTANKQAAELQNRILTILNSKAVSSQQAAPSPVNPPSEILPNNPMKTSISQILAKNTASSQSNSQAKTSAPLLNDPSVQKALDSLLQGDILKKIVTSDSNTLLSKDDNISSSYSANIRHF